MSDDIKKDLLEALKQKRDEIIDRENTTSFLVFTDQQLEDIAEAAPETKKDLKKISGVGPVKIDKYGQDVLETVAQFKSDADADSDDIENEVPETEPVIEETTAEFITSEENNPSLVEKISDDVDDVKERIIETLHIGTDETEANDDEDTADDEETFVDKIEGNFLGDEEEEEEEDEEDEPEENVLEEETEFDDDDAEEIIYDEPIDEIADIDESIEINDEITDEEDVIMITGDDTVADVEYTKPEDDGIAAEDGEEPIDTEIEDIDIPETEMLIDDIPATVDVFGENDDENENDDEEDLVDSLQGLMDATPTEENPVPFVSANSVAAVDDDELDDIIDDIEELPEDIDIDSIMIDTEPEETIRTGETVPVPLIEEEKQPEETHSQVGGSELVQAAAVITSGPEISPVETVVVTPDDTDDEIDLITEPLVGSDAVTAEIPRADACETEPELTDEEARRKALDWLYNTKIEVGEENKATEEVLPDENTENITATAVAATATVTATATAAAAQPVASVGDKKKKKHGTGAVVGMLILGLVIGGVAGAAGGYFYEKGKADDEIAVYKNTVTQQKKDSDTVISMLNSQIETLQKQLNNAHKGQTYETSNTNSNTNTSANTNTNGNPGTLNATLSDEQYVTGAKVTSLQADGAGEKGGLRVGDVIIKVGDTTVKNAQEANDAIHSYHKGDTVLIGLAAGNSVKVTLG